MTGLLDDQMMAKNKEDGPDIPVPGFVSPDRSSRMSAFDLYEDLLVKDSEKESLVSIHEVNQEREALKDENKRLMEELKALHEKNAKLSTEKESIQSNFAKLLVTARVEITRKNKLITTIQERPRSSVPNRKTAPIHSKQKQRPLKANIERRSKPQRSSLKGARIDDDPTWRKKFMKNLTGHEQENEILEVEKMIKEKRLEGEDIKNTPRSDVKQLPESVKQLQNRIQNKSNVDDNLIAKQRISRGIVSNKSPDKQPRLQKSPSKVDKSALLKDTAVEKTNRIGNVTQTQNTAVNTEKINSPLKRKTLATIVKRSPIKFPRSKNNKPDVKTKKTISVPTKKTKDHETPTVISSPTASNTTVENPPKKSTDILNKVNKKPDEIVAEKLNMALQQMAESDKEIDSDHDLVPINSNTDIPKNIDNPVTIENHNEQIQKVIEISEHKIHLEEIKLNDQKKMNVTTSALDNNDKDIKISPEISSTIVSAVPDIIQKKIDSQSMTTTLSDNTKANNEELKLKKIVEDIENAADKNADAPIGSGPASVELNIEEDQDDLLGIQPEENDDLEEGEICSSSEDDVPQNKQEKVSRRSLLFKQDRNRSLEEKSSGKISSEQDKRVKVEEKPIKDLKSKNKLVTTAKHHDDNRRRSTSRNRHSVSKQPSHERERSFSYNREGKEKKYIDDRRKERNKDCIDRRSARSSKERDHERIGSGRKHLERRPKDSRRDEQRERESWNRHNRTKESVRRKGSSYENERRLDRRESRNSIQNQESARLSKTGSKSKYDEKHRRQQSNIESDSKRNKLPLQRSRSKNDSDRSRPPFPGIKSTKHNLKRHQGQAIIDKSASFNEIRKEPEDIGHNLNAVDVLDLGLDTWFDFDGERHLPLSPAKKTRQHLTMHEEVVRRSPRKHKSSKSSPLHKTVLTKHLTPDKTSKKTVTPNNKSKTDSAKKLLFPKRLQLKLHDLKDELHVSDFNELCTNKSMSVKDGYNSNSDNPEKKNQIPSIKSPLSASWLNSPHHIPAESPCSSVALEIDEGLDYDEDSLMANPIFSEKSPRNDPTKKEEKLEDRSKVTDDEASQRVVLKSKRKASKDLSSTEHTKKPKIASPVFKGVIKKVSKPDKPQPVHEDRATSKVHNKDSVPKTTKTKSIKKKNKLPLKKSPKKNLTATKSRTPKIRLNKAGLLSKNKKLFRVFSTSSEEEDDIVLDKARVFENIKRPEMPHGVTCVTPIKDQDNSVLKPEVTEQSKSSSNQRDSITLYKKNIAPSLSQSGIVMEDTSSLQPTKETSSQNGALSEEDMNDGGSDLETIDETYSSNSCDSFNESQSYNTSLNNYRNAALQQLLSLAHRTLAAYRRDNKIPTSPTKKEPRRVSTEWVSEVPRSERSRKNPERFLSPPSTHRSVWLRSLEEADKRRKLRNRWSSETHSETDTSVSVTPSIDQDIPTSTVVTTPRLEQPPLTIINEESRLASDVASSASVLSLSDLTMTEESRCNLLSMMNVVKPLTPMKATPPRLLKIYNTPPEVNAKKRKKVRKKLQSSM